MDAKDSRERKGGEVSIFLQREQDASESWTREDWERFMAEQRDRISSLPQCPRGVSFLSPRRMEEERVVVRYGGHSHSTTSGVFVDTSLCGAVVAMMPSVDCGSSCHC
jgi:hypothetical protein